MADFDINAARMRFFRDMVKAEREQVFRVFGIEEKVLEEVRTHSDERRVFNYLFARRAVPAQASAPEGWSLVPIEPTDDMREACRVLNYCDDIDAEWARMLAAAPVPAQGERDTNTNERTD